MKQEKSQIINAQEKEFLNQQAQFKMKTKSAPRVQVTFLFFKTFQIMQVQTIMKLFFVTITVVSAIFVKKLYIFQTHEHFANIQKGLLSDIIYYSLPFAILFTIFDAIVHKIFDPIFEKHYITEKRYTEPQSKKKRVYTLVKWAYSIVYYLISSIWGYKIISNTTFLPTWLGGLGTSPYNLSYQIDMPEATLEMRIFYILQAGKHLSRFSSHLFIRPEGAYFQYALHHGLSVFLIIFSFLTNQWLVGILVLVLHDYSDFALILARTYKDYKHLSKKLLDAIYVHAFAFWISCRILLFSYCCIYRAIDSFCQQNIMDEFSRQVMNPLIVFMIVMMMVLQLLHLYWTYYIAESFVAIKVDPKLARHSYD